MNLKKKLESTKDKIKQNAPVIIAIASTSAAVGIAVVNHLIKAEHSKELARRCDERNGDTHLHLSVEAEQRLADGRKARFTHPDMDFNIIVHKEETKTEA